MGYLGGGGGGAKKGQILCLNSLTMGENGNKFGQLIDASFRPIFRLYSTLGKSGPLWASLGQFGPIWATLGKFGPIRAGLGHFGQVRAAE